MPREMRPEPVEGRSHSLPGQDSDRSSSEIPLVECLHATLTGLPLPSQRRELCVRKIAFAAAGVLLSVGLLSPTQALAIDQVNTEKLRKAITVAGILQHERAFQRIANNNDGTRASGTPGYDASADYVVQKLRKAG